MSFFCLSVLDFPGVFALTQLDIDLCEIKRSLMDISVLINHCVSSAAAAASPSCENPFNCELTIGGRHVDGAVGGGSPRPQRHLVIFTSESSIL